MFFVIIYYHYYAFPALTKVNATNVDEYYSMKALLFMGVGSYDLLRGISLWYFQYESYYVMINAKY